MFWRRKFRKIHKKKLAPETYIPVDTRRCFNVYKTSIRRRRRLTDVKTTSCVYWVSIVVDLSNRGLVKHIHFWDRREDFSKNFVCQGISLGLAEMDD